MSDVSVLPNDPITAYLGQLESVMNAAPAALANAANTGDFASVLNQLQTQMNPPAAATATGASSPALAGSNGASASTVVADALSYLGTPYVWGGSSPSGFDCSGFVQYVYNEVGVGLPRTSQEQANVGVPVASLVDAQPGDLVFFAGADGSAQAPGHVGIYLGNGEMIDAPQTGSAVSIQPVGTPVAIRRILASASDTATLTSSTSGGGVSVPPALAPALLGAASKNGVPAQLLAAVANEESGFDPNATSAAGAEGVMQLLPETAAGLGVDPYDPAQAFDGAARLLGSYLQQYHSVPLALAAYNAGPAAVAQYGGIPPFPETEQYVQNIMQTLGASS